MIPEQISSEALRAISKTLAEAIELSCTCNLAPHGDGYMKHAKTCGVHFNRIHYRRVARFLAVEFRKRNLNQQESEWIEAANSLIEQPKHLV